MSASAALTLPFPVRDDRKRAQLTERYMQLREGRPHRDEHRFSLLVPKGWRPVDQEPGRPSSKAPAALLAQYVAEEGPPAMVEVSLVLLEREISVHAWLKIRLEDLGETLVTARRVQFETENTVDVLTTREIEGHTVVSRWVVRRVGKRLFWLKAFTAAEDYPQVARDFHVAIASFEPGVHAEGRTIERLQAYTRARPADFHFYYPSSWLREERSLTQSKAGVLATEFYNFFGDAPVGKLSFLTHGSLTRPEALIDLFLDLQRKNGLDVNMGERFEGPLFGDLEEVHMQLGVAHLRTHPPTTEEAPPLFELHLACGRRGRTWYLIGLVGLGPVISPDAHAINRRAYEIVCQSLRTERV